MTRGGISRQRTAIVGAVGVLALGAILAVAVTLPYRFHDGLDRGRQSRAGKSQVSSYRGSIYDRQGQPLAVTEPEAELIADLRELSLQLHRSGESVEVVTGLLSRELGLEPEATKALQDKLFFPMVRAMALRQELEKVRNYEEKKAVQRALRQVPGYLPIISRISLPHAERLRSLKAKARPGLRAADAKKLAPGFMRAFRVIRRTVRRYPEQGLAGHVIGFTNRDGLGVSGAEALWQDYLAPRSQKVEGARDRKRHFLPKERMRAVHELLGADVYLTLHQGLQAVLERELDGQVKSQAAKAGAAVVLDANTGAILAMASNPRMNPSLSQQRVGDRAMNRVTQYGYELGSTVKPFVVAAGLETRRIREDQWLDCDKGRIMIPGRRRPLWDHHKMEACNITMIIAHSSNVGTIKIGRATGPRTVRALYERVGLVETPNVGLGSVAPGRLPRIRARGWMSATDSDTMMFGYALRGTLLSVTGAYTAFATGGQRLTPFITDRIRIGAEEFPAPRPQRVQVLDKETVEKILPMLEAVVNTEEGQHPARIPGVVAGGKTGTSVKYIPGLGYNHQHHHASFVGILPLYEPRFVIGVMLDEPKDRYGAAAAGPVFREVGAWALEHLANQAPEEEDSAEVVSALRRVRESLPVHLEEEEIAASRRALGTVAKRLGLLPDFRGLDLRTAVAELQGLGLDTALQGEGQVVGQTPAPSTPLDQVDGQVLLHLGRL
ncbi:MAG: hypothetical protein CMH55_09065 [Myxococcales bacterium]|nr:hypothetical protein [Myxococcales bacterium]